MREINREGRLLERGGGKYRESQISSKNSNFGLYHPNNHLGNLFQEMILRNPQALYITFDFAGAKDDSMCHVYSVEDCMKGLQGNLFKLPYM